MSLRKDTEALPFSSSPSEEKSFRYMLFYRAVVFPSCYSSWCHSEWKHTQFDNAFWARAQRWKLKIEAILISLHYHSYWCEDGGNLGQKFPHYVIDCFALVRREGRKTTKGGSEYRLQEKSPSEENNQFCFLFSVFTPKVGKMIKRRKFCAALEEY